MCILTYSRCTCRCEVRDVYPQASPLAEWLYVPSGKQMNVGLNPAVGAGFFLARKTGVCYGYGAGVALGSQKSIHAQHI